MYIFIDKVTSLYLLLQSYLQLAGSNKNVHVLCYV